MQPQWEAPTPNPVINPLLFRANSQIPEYPDNPIFVLIRAAEKRNIDIAQSSRKWVFSPQTEKKVIHYAMVIKLEKKISQYWKPLIPEREKDLFGVLRQWTANIHGNSRVQVD